MSIRRIISTGVISTALVLSTSTAALANSGGGGGRHHHHGLLDLAVLIHLGLLDCWHHCGGLLGLL